MHSGISSKFRAFIGVAPVVYVGHMTSFLAQTGQVLDVKSYIRKITESVLYLPDIGPIGG